MIESTDTMELRRKYAEKFLAAPHEHGDAVLEGPIDTLITEFDAELSAAKKRYRTLRADAEWAEMSMWLADHGYHHGYVFYEDN